MLRNQSKIVQSDIDTHFIYSSVVLHSFSIIDCKNMILSEAGGLAMRIYTADSRPI